MDYTTIKTDLAAISAEMAQKRKELDSLVTQGASQSAELASLNTRYAGLVTAVNALGTAAHEQVAKAELAEFIAIRDELQTIATAIANA